MITCEYPPDTGGLSGYSWSLVDGLNAMGVRVSVWTRGEGSMKDFSPADLWRTGRAFRERDGRNILVQWVPHGYGFHAVNFPFCCWLLWRRVRHGDRVVLMVHETFLDWTTGGLRQFVAAFVQRAMTAVLLQSSRHVFVSIPEWIRRLKPLAFGLKVPFEWLPVPSNVPLEGREEDIQVARAAYGDTDSILIGHFGTYNKELRQLLCDILPSLLNRCPDARVVLLGKNSVEFAQELRSLAPEHGDRIRASGLLDSRRLSAALSACDVMIQPYSDGISTRRGSAMAALSHGLPTVSTHGFLSEPFWTGCGAVSLVPSGDAEAFVRSTADLITDPERRQRLGMAGRKLYAERFDVEHTVRAVAATVRRLEHMNDN